MSESSKRNCSINKINKWTSYTIDWSINQSINQINQSINQSDSQSSNNHPSNRSINQSISSSRGTSTHMKLLFSTENIKTQYKIFSQKKTKTSKNTSVSKVPFVKKWKYSGQCRFMIRLHVCAVWSWIYTVRKKYLQCWEVCSKIENVRNKKKAQRYQSWRQPFINFQTLHIDFIASICYYGVLKAVRWSFSSVYIYAIFCVFLSLGGFFTRFILISWNYKGPYTCGALSWGSMSALQLRVCCPEFDFQKRVCRLLDVGASTDVVPSKQTWEKFVKVVRTCFSIEYDVK